MEKRIWVALFVLSVSFNAAAIGGIALQQRARAQVQASQVGDDDVRPRLELRLSAAQQETFDRLRQTFNDERDRRETQINSVREALVRELVADRPDSSRIDALLDQMTVSQSQVQRSLVNRLLQERAALRPDQRAVFARFLERRLLRGGTPRTGGEERSGSSTQKPRGEVK
jgi:Spy/CpxP family protein refolding chaperone